MWARAVEVMLGCWLAISPFVFRHASGETGLWVNDLSSGFAVIALALTSFWRPLRRAHLLIGVIGVWLVLFGFFADRPAPPASQNHILMGLLLVMFAIIPNDASLPPESWRNFPPRSDLGS